LKHETSSFLSGCAPLADFMFFSKEADELVDEDQSNSSFFSYDEDEKEDPFRKYDVSASWVAIAMTTIKPISTGLREVIAVAPDGEYWELEPLTTNEFTGVIKVIRGSIRSLTVVDDIVYGCGMARTVLKREYRDNWVEFGPPDSQSGAVIGFEDLSGFNGSDIYAVGWSGEIWHFNGENWSQIDSPVSSILSAVCCAEDGFVYAVGHDGVMLKGRGDSWTVIGTGRKEKLMDVQFYAGQIYVATNFDVLKLTDHGLVLDADFPADDRPSTCLHLLKAADGLFSMGTKDLWRKKTSGWQRIV
jgi:photosystem II stability/assembly factor-like uncharacterized protein